MPTNLPAWPGTISIAANSTAVVGTGTAFTTAAQGAVIIAQLSSGAGVFVGQFAADPTDDTHATLMLAPKSAISGASYVLVPVSGAVAQAQRVRTTLETLAALPTTAGQIGAATETALADADESGWYQAASGNLIKRTWANIKSQLNSTLSFLGLSGGTMTGEIDSTADNFLRPKNGSIGAIFRLDSSNLYILLTNAGDQDGTYNSLRPFSVALTTGSVTLGNGATVNNGLDLNGGFALNTGQISFPATQNPSSGANTLDDYEEGSATPVLAFGGSSAGIAYSGRSLTYIKVGTFCHGQGNFTLTSKGSATGTSTVGGQPFLVSGTASATVGRLTGMVSVTSPQAFVNSTSGMVPENCGASGDTSMNDGNFSNITTFFWAAHIQASQ